MIKEGKIGAKEAVCLITITITNRVFFTSPGLLSKTLGTSGWYMTLISALFGAIGFTFICMLLKKYPGKDLIEIFKAVLGKYLSFLFLIILSFMLMTNAAVMLREFAEVMKVYVFSLTPLNYIMGLFILVVTITSILGLESIARFSAFIGVVLLIAFISVLVLSYQNYEIHRLAPILGYGLDKTIITGMSRCAVYADPIILAVVAGSMQGLSHIKRAGYLSIAISGILISASFAAFALAFPYYALSEITAPMYQLVSLIDYGRFLQRLESIFLFIWNIATFISVAINFYAAASTWCKTFTIEDTKPVILPMAILTFAIAMIPKDIAELSMGTIQNVRTYGWVVFFILPILTLIVSMFRKKGAEGKNA